MGQCLSTPLPPPDYQQQWQKQQNNALADGMAMRNPYEQKKSNGTSNYTTTADVGMNKGGFLRDKLTALQLDPIDENASLSIAPTPTPNGQQQTATGAMTPHRSTASAPSQNVPGPRQPLHWSKGELIGQGAFGSVYLGMDTDTGELMAVKQVALRKNMTNAKVMEHIREVEAEVQLLQNLHHANIVRYLGTERTEEALNIFLEYVPGGSIASLLSKFGSFKESVVKVYTKQILLGLEYLHNNGIMHRDIKGANILVDNTGLVKLADFGASKKIEDLVTIDSGFKSVKGTAYWMAPEVIKQSGHGRQADIWSVACTVIEMATGRPPWTQFDSQVSAMFHIASSKGPPAIPEHLSAECKDFLYLCFNRNWRERPPASRLLQHPFLADITVRTVAAPMNNLASRHSVTIPGIPINITNPTIKPMMIQEEEDEPRISAARQSAQTAVENPLVAVGDVGLAAEQRTPEKVHPPSSRQQQQQQQQEMMQQSGMSPLGNHLGSKRPMPARRHSDIYVVNGVGAAPGGGAGIPARQGLAQPGPSNSPDRRINTGNAAVGSMGNNGGGVGNGVRASAPVMFSGFNGGVAGGQQPDGILAANTLLPLRASPTKKPERKSSQRLSQQHQGVDGEENLPVTPVLGAGGHRSSSGKLNALLAQQEAHQAQQQQQRQQHSDSQGEPTLAIEPGLSSDAGGEASVGMQWGRPQRSTSQSGVSAAGPANSDRSVELPATIVALDASIASRMRRTHSTGSEAELIAAAAACGGVARQSSAGSLWSQASGRSGVDAREGDAVSLATTTPLESEGGSISTRPLTSTSQLSGASFRSAFNPMEEPVELSSWNSPDVPAAIRTSTASDQSGVLRRSSSSSSQRRGHEGPIVYTIDNDDVDSGLPWDKQGDADTNWLVCSTSQSGQQLLKQHRGSRDTGSAEIPSLTLDQEDAILSALSRQASMDLRASMAVFEKVRARSAGTTSSSHSQSQASPAKAAPGSMSKSVPMAPLLPSAHKLQPRPSSAGTTRIPSPVKIPPGSAAKSLSRSGSLHHGASTPARGAGGRSPTKLPHPPASYAALAAAAGTPSKLVAATATPSASKQLQRSQQQYASMDVTGGAGGYADAHYAKQAQQRRSMPTGVIGGYAGASPLKTPGRVARASLSGSAAKTPGGQRGASSAKQSTRQTNRALVL